MKKKVVEEELKVENFIKIIIGVIAVFALFYAITYFITNKNKNNADTNENIQYKKIIVGSILNRSEDDYYVLVSASSDTSVSVYESLITKYTSKESHLRFYTVDLSDPFNSNYVGEESNLNVENISDIKFSETTLLHVKNNKIVSYRVGNDIETYLNNLSA